MSAIYTAGNKGGKVRSDCFVSLEQSSSEGIHIELVSKVRALYGKDIEDLSVRILKHFDIRNAVLRIDDSGALPFVLAARIETVARRMTGLDRSWVLPLTGENRYPSERDRFRFSRLYLPGNTPSMMINAGIHQPDGIILDLEDSVAPEKKGEARILVRNALCQVNFYGAERMVRINQIPGGLDDLVWIVPYNVHMILIPKCEDPEQVILVEREIGRISNQCGRKEPVYLMPIIESALGVEKAFAIASASPVIAAMAVGLEDYTADLGVSRTPGGEESFYARSRVVNACRAAGIQAIDSVYSDAGDETGLQENIRRSKAMGFEGMGCIHPRQIRMVHEGYAPSVEGIEKAKQVVAAYLKAEEQGLGVVALGTKMIDAPVVRRALKTIELAIKLGLVEKNWREDHDE